MTYNEETEIIAAPNIYGMTYTSLVPLTLYNDLILITIISLILQMWGLIQSHQGQK